MLLARCSPRDRRTAGRTLVGEDPRTSADPSSVLGATPSNCSEMNDARRAAPHASPPVLRRSGSWTARSSYCWSKRSRPVFLGQNTLAGRPRPRTAVLRGSRASTAPSSSSWSRWRRTAAGVRSSCSASAAAVDGPLTRSTAPRARRSVPGLEAREAPRRIPQRQCAVNGSGASGRPASSGLLQVPAAGRLTGVDRSAPFLRWSPSATCSMIGRLAPVLRSRAGVVVSVPVPVVTLPRLPQVPLWPGSARLAPWVTASTCSALRWRALRHRNSRRWFLRASPVRAAWPAGPRRGRRPVAAQRVDRCQAGPGDAVLSVGTTALVGATRPQRSVAFAGTERSACCSWSRASPLAAILVVLIVARVRPGSCRTVRSPAPGTRHGLLPPRATSSHRRAARARWAPLALAGAGRPPAPSGQPTPRPNGASPRDGALVVGLVAAGVPWARRGRRGVHQGRRRLAAGPGRAAAACCTTAAPPSSRRGNDPDRSGPARGFDVRPPTGTAAAGGSIVRTSGVASCRVALPACAADAVGRRPGSVVVALGVFCYFQVRGLTAATPASPLRTPATSWRSRGLRLDVRGRRPGAVQSSRRASRRSRTGLIWGHSAGHHRHHGLARLSAPPPVPAAPGRHVRLRGDRPGRLRDLPAGPTSPSTPPWSTP